MQDPNEIIFTRATLPSAMSTNCGYYHGVSVQERFAVETPALVGSLGEYLQNTNTVLDFGIGVGRFTKAILDQYPQVNIIGVDNSRNMLNHAQHYIPANYFRQGRIRLYTPDQIDTIQLASVGLILAVFVLQHVTAGLLEPTFDKFDRLLKEDGKLYVLNRLGRAVPREDRLRLYASLRRMLRFLEYYCEYKQVQRLSQKLDNRCLVHDDGINIQEELSRRFIPIADITFNTHSHLERLTRKHFSRLYGKKQTI